MPVRIAIVEGDDVLPLAAAMRAAGTVEMSSGEPMPERLVTANAYLGAPPVARALDAGADIVITGRCVDSAVTLGVLERGRRLLRESGLADFLATNIELLGAESAYGPHARPLPTREVVLRLTVTHADRRALEMFSREFAAPGTSWSSGTTGAGGRPSVSAVLRQFAWLIAKKADADRHARRDDVYGDPSAATIRARTRTACDLAEHVARRPAQNGAARADRLRAQLTLITLDTRNFFATLAACTWRSGSSPMRFSSALGRRCAIQRS